MQVITETEYETLVEETADRAFDPFEHSDLADEIVDLVEANQDEAARDKLYARVHDEVAGAARYLTDGRVMWLDDLPSVMHGGIVQHSFRSVSPSTRDTVTELHGSWGSETNPENNVAREAFIALFRDVKAEVWNRARSLFENDD